MSDYFMRTGFRIEILSRGPWRRYRTSASAVAWYFERQRLMRGLTMRIRGQA